jgi:hypothetical protein
VTPAGTTYTTATAASSCCVAAPAAHHSVELVCGDAWPHRCCCRVQHLTPYPASAPDARDLVCTAYGHCSRQGAQDMACGLLQPATKNAVTACYIAGLLY